jgi:hypothetical protein
MAAKASDKQGDKLSPQSYLDQMEKQFSELEKAQPVDQQALLDAGRKLAYHRETQGKSSEDLVPRMRAALSHQPNPSASPTKN